MEITACYPEIFVKDLDAALKRYTEELGFKRLHTVDDGFVKLHVLDLQGCRVDIFTSDDKDIRMEQDGFYAMRVNVRDFDEGIAYYRAQGYRITLGPASTPFMKLAVLEKETGERIFLFHHIREHTP